MAKGVKKIKWVGERGVLSNFSVPDKILCIKPDQEAPFVVGEWYNETTEEEKRHSIKWLWMDQRKRTIFHKTIKPSGIPFGVTLPKKLCGSYAFYLEASLYGKHDQRNTGLHVYGKCEKKIISSSWSKKGNTADNGEIIYGNDLYVTLEAEGINGDSLKLETYSMKKPDRPIHTEEATCINGTLRAKFKTMSFYMSLQGLPDYFENFYIKVLEITGDYLKNANGSDKVFSFTIKNERVMPVFEPPTNTTPLKVDDPPKEEEVKTEGIITAYFAKEEFSLETSEIANQHRYIFQNKNIGIDKDKVAKIIKDRVDAQVKGDKKYAKLEDIKNSLTNDSYDNGAFVSFNLCKLGAQYIKINSAPLEEEVYVVAKTFLLDGKEVTIKIKEKETILVDADADVPVLEAKENGEELTTLKATVEKGLAKVKVKLRPKADEDLKIWKEKLLKGKKDGIYSYTFKSDTAITDSNKKQFATIILNNAKEGKQGNTKIETGKTAFVDDVEKALDSKTFISGRTISFDTYKTQAENLWLQAKCQGDAVKHEGEFLKKHGDYFVIGKGKCPRCEALITAKDFKEMFPDVTQLFNKGTNTLSSTTIDDFLEALNKTVIEFKINTCTKKAFFLAQISKETGFFSRIDENLNYTTEEALHNFWLQTNHPKLYSNPNDFLYNPEKLGNYVYRNVAENGDEESGDGYKFRGRGLIQITRKKGYRRFGEFAGKDLKTNPDILLEDLNLMVRSAGWYWKHGVLLNNGTEKDLNTVAEKGDFKEITRLVHGSTDDVSAREIILKKIKTVLKTDKCQKNAETDIEYHIQSSGEIQYKIQNDKREMAEYFYHDSTGFVHNLGKYKLNKVKEIYGAPYKDRLKDSENIYLIDIRIVNKSYNSNGKKFTLAVNTNRYYMNDVTVASLFGAMLECGYEDFVFNGFSNEKGETIGGSHSHKNGMNGDLRYLRTDKKGGTTDLFNSSEELGWKGLDESRQNNFNDALYKFGWKSMLSQNYGLRKENLLNKCINDRDNGHNDHLHIQGYSPTLKEI